MKRLSSRRPVKAAPLPLDCIEPSRAIQIKFCNSNGAAQFSIQARDPFEL